MLDHIRTFFGHDLAKARILEAVNIRNVHFLPLYVLNYIFSDDELSDRELESHVVETAQYSLHVVGLIFDPDRTRVIIADSNGALIPGSNMEFLSMPLKTRRASDSTRVSRYDLDCRKRGSSGVSKSRKRRRMTPLGRWTLDAGQRERRLSKNDNPWTGHWAERTTVAEE